MDSSQSRYLHKANPTQFEPEVAAQGLLDDSLQKIAESLEDLLRLANAAGVLADRLLGSEPPKPEEKSMDNHDTSFVGILRWRTACLDEVVKDLGKTVMRLHRL